MKQNSMRFFLIPVLIILLSLNANSKSVSLNQLMNNTATPFIENNNIPGAAIAIFFNGSEYYFNYGLADKKTPVTQNTIFELASVTKIFVTTLLASEILSKKINLADPVTKYIPKLSNTKGLAIDQVKVVNLATHTASFPRQMEQFGVAQGDITGFLTVLKSWKPRIPIGSHYNYSNVSFGLLGTVLEGATDQSLSTLLDKIITQPLDMTNTYFDVPKSKRSYLAQAHGPRNGVVAEYVPVNFLGGGALHSTSSDLLKFMKANLGLAVEQASPQLLSAMQLAQQPYFEVRPNFVLGLGWQRVKRGSELLITKNGGNQGFSTFIGFSPSKKLGVVVLINRSRSRAEFLGNKILNKLLILQSSQRS